MGTGGMGCHSRCGVGMQMFPASDQVACLNVLPLPYCLAELFEPRVALPCSLKLSNGSPLP